MGYVVLGMVMFCCKRKTAYEMRISDWSSDVCSSDLKHVRAEPISALYSLGRVSHIGAFPKLEDQMCQMTAAGYEGEGSPDRCDALVWGKIGRASWRDRVCQYV